MLAVTVDVEDWYHIPSVCGSPFSVFKDTNEFFKKWNKRYDYLSEPTKRVLDLLDDMDVTATFFVVADVVEHYPGLLESIIVRGHEIGCHGLYHSLKIHPKTKEPLMSINEFKQRTLKAKINLEKVCRNKIIGYRSPGAYVGGWMLDILVDLDFKYDSSVCVNSIYNKTDSSLKNVNTYPYYPKKGSLEPGKKRNFIEFPWSYYEIFGVRVPTSGGPTLRFLGDGVVLRGLKQSLNKGHTLFYFHPIDLSREKFPNIGKGRPFYWAIKGEIIERRIIKVLKTFRKMNVRMSPMSECLGDML
ncbi:MAG: polysaccharide deacetylase family protein [Thermoplasmata archaeon]|nr:MAG: polysaccharide deacetylase family protein [Thermoplasmata archaeon]